MHEYWQVEAGSFGRDYSEAFLRYGIAFGGEIANQIDGVQVGHRIVLKRGRAVIQAVGVVLDRGGRCNGHGDKDWLLQFDGWKLPDYCFVEWHRPTEPVQLAAMGLDRRTFVRLNNVAIQEAAEKILSDCPIPLEIDPEPRLTKRVTTEEILDFLVAEGLSIGAAEDFTFALNRIVRLASYYTGQCWWTDVREHETRTFLNVPLLLALGWSEQQIKIELPNPAGRIDISCFARPHRRDHARKENITDCVLLIEGKGLSSGLDFATEQAHVYARHFPSCRVAAVSNGYCYKTYERSSDGSFSTKPTAYTNLLDPRDRYPLDPAEVDGTLAVLKMLLPRSLR